MATRAAPTSTAATPGAGETHSGVRRDEVAGSAQVLCRCSCALLGPQRAPRPCALLVLPFDTRVWCGVVRRFNRAKTCSASACRYAARPGRETRPDARERGRRHARPRAWLVDAPRSRAGCRVGASRSVHGAPGCAPPCTALRLCRRRRGWLARTSAQCTAQTWCAAQRLCR